MPRLALVLIVGGGSPEPLVRAINNSRPDLVCYLISEEGLRRMGELVPMLEHRPAIERKIVVCDYESLTACHEAARRCLEVTEREGFSVEETIVDLSGGTPPLVAGMVAAAAPLGYKFQYLKTPGKPRRGYPFIRYPERAFLHEKFSDRIFSAELRQVGLLFDNAQFTGARILIEEILTRAEEDRRFFLKALARVIRGYEAWDLLAYHRALDEMAKGASELEWYRSIRGDERESPLGLFVIGIKENSEFLGNLVNGADEGRVMRLQILDLLANAARRAAGGAYEDAMARLHRAAGLLARLALARRGLGPGDLRLEDLPKRLREEFADGYMEEDGRLRLSMPAAYRLLAAMRDPVGRRFEGNPEAARILETCEASIPLPCPQTVDAETYTTLAAFLRELAGVEEEEFPRIPRFAF